MSTDCHCGCGGPAGANAFPLSTVNRPGLPALDYRIGTHAVFFAALKARLSTLCLGSDAECRMGKGLYPLRDLTTRDPGDPAIALLDGWAVVADVLSFYQERIANEGFLRTATERRSILELARLVGYQLRPGVAASVHLAYTLEEDRSVFPPKPTAATIPAGSRVQSVPGPGELPQPFETSEDLVARSEWNRLSLRMTRPQTKASIKARGIFFKGTSTGLKVNDALLIDFAFGGEKPDILPVRVVAVEVDAEADRTHVTIRLWRTMAETIQSLKTAALSLKESVFAIAAETSAANRLGKNISTHTAELTGLHPADRSKFIREKLLGLLRKNRPAMQGKFIKLPGILDTLITDLELGAESAELNNFEDFHVGEDASDEATSTRVADLLSELQAEPSQQPASRLDRPQAVSASFAAKSDNIPRILGTLRPGLRTALYQAMSHAVSGPPSRIRIYAFRVTAPVFGYNASPKPLKFDREGNITTSGDWPIIEKLPKDPGDDSSESKLLYHEDERVINLDTSYDKIRPNDWVMVETAETKLTQAGLMVVRAPSVNIHRGRSEYGLTGKTTRIVLEPATIGGEQRNWIQFDNKTEKDSDFNAIRLTTVFAQAEELELAEEPITEPIGHCAGGDGPDPTAVRLELSRLYDGLDVGRWLIVSGERIISGTSGVTASELVMLAGVSNDADSGLPGDKTHTHLTLAGDGLAYCYKRDTVVIHGNVVNATHGETRVEPAGGDALKAFQQFDLKQSPLTHVSAPNPSGIESTLQLRVNGVRWHETDSLAELEPTEHKFVTRTDDDNNTFAIAGDGRHGARLPTGPDNVKLTYRSGIGKPGNVKAGQISLLVSRPLNVKEVINPLPATGGADRESRDLARVNAPLAVMALDRLVSTQDYADFARRFAGVGKAEAARLTDGAEQVVHVTIAGFDDIPIAESSDLFRNLGKSFRDFGDPFLPVQLARRDLLLLVLEAGVRVRPDYLWEAVEPKVRAALLDRFGFNRRELGQDAVLSEIFSAIQAVEGVAYADVDVFTTVTEAQIIGLLNGTDTIKIERSERIRVETARIDPDATDPAKRIQPAQLACFTPDVPEILILKELKS